jgi:PKHD-type hydroxylase
MKSSNVIKLQPKIEEEYKNSIWSFEVDNTHGWAFANDVFSPDECKKIIEIGEKYKLKEAVVGANKQPVTEIRESSINWIFPQEDTEWIYYRMTNLVKHLNDNYFKFNLFGFIEGFQFTKYEAPSGHYGMHIDKMFGKTIRKLSITVQLSDPADYEGGNLQLIFGKEPDVMDKRQGMALAFPSYALHEVTPVTKGTRYSLVAWVTGESFK